MRGEIRDHVSGWMKFGGLVTRKSVFLALAVVLGFSGTAIAQDQCAALVSGGSCNCAKPLEASDVVARLSDVAGGVRITGRQGLASASRATPILIGDSVIVPSGGHAVFDFGASCSRTRANASVVVTAIGGCACARIENADVNAMSRPASLPPHALAQGAIPPPSPGVEAIDQTMDDSASADTTAPAGGGLSAGVLGAGVVGTILATTIVVNELSDDEEPVSEE